MTRHHARLRLAARRKSKTPGGQAPVPKAPAAASSPTSVGAKQPEGRGEPSARHDDSTLASGGSPNHTD
jgi:hypothetical protein